MIDKVIEGDLRSGAVAHSRSLGGRKRLLAQVALPDAPTEQVEKAAADALKAGRGRPHVQEAIEAVQASTRLPFAEALAQERATFQRLRSGTEAAALRHLFFAEREASKVPGLEGVAARDLGRIGIVGAGTMGVGIATCFIEAGYSVTLVEQDEAGAQRGLERMREIQERAVSSGRIADDEAKRRLAQVRPSGNLKDLADADLVLEAVFEDMDVKIDLFRRLESVVRPDTILASNTSYLDLDRIAQSTSHPANVVGLHFFSPAHVMKLLEIVRAADTGAATLATAVAVGKRLRKTAVVARVGEGFIGNRIYAAYRRQCEFMLEEGAYPEEVDKALTAFGFAMGPFAVSDMSGLDIAWKMRQRLAATRDPKSRYVEIADRLCEQGRLGQKTGAGWYKYAPGKRGGEPDSDVRALIDASSAAKGIARRSFTAEEISRRALLTMVNEAALLLEEGIAARPSDVDLVIVSGYGFPRHEGGPLFWASRQDRGRIESELDEIAALSGHGFRKGKRGRRSRASAASGLGGRSAPPQALGRHLVDDADDLARRFADRLARALGCGQRHRDITLQRRVYDLRGLKVARLDFGPDRMQRQHGVQMLFGNDGLEELQRVGLDDRGNCDPLAPRERIECVSQSVGCARQDERQPVERCERHLRRAGQPIALRPDEVTVHDGQRMLALGNRRRVPIQNRDIEPTFAKPFLDLPARPFEDLEMNRGVQFVHSLEEPPDERVS
jgi:3-hydroxyacyl-CoA dehydrogenase